MFVSDRTMKLLIESGVESDKLVAILQSLRDDEAALRPPAPQKDRSKGAERMARYRERRRANGLDPDFRGAEYADQLRERDGSLCVYCADAEGAVVDHMVPCSQGGDDDLDNLALSCHACNCGKGGRTPEQAGYTLRSATARAAYVRYARTFSARSANESARNAHDDAPPRARVESNNLPTEITNLTTPDFSQARWPECEPPSKADLDQLEAALTEAAGDALASRAVAPKIAILAPILRLAKAGKGPPCDLQADVLPVIRARSARAPPGSVKSWEFFTEAICEARDRRLSGAPALQPVTPDERDHPRRPRQTPDRSGQRTDANIAGAALALARRNGLRAGSGG